MNPFRDDHHGRTSRWQKPAWISVDSRVLGRQDNSIANYKAPLENPLRIVLSGNQSHDLGIYMRTPGNDLELITGLLYNEGIINGHKDIISTEIDGEVATVLLRDVNPQSISPNDRPFLVTGSCGVCGRESCTTTKWWNQKKRFHNIASTNITKPQGIIKDYSTIQEVPMGPQPSM